MKLDSGFPVGSNLSKWHELLNATGRPVMVENCHQGGEAPGMVDTQGVHSSLPPSPRILLLLRLRMRLSAADCD